MHILIKAHNSIYIKYISSNKIITWNEKIIMLRNRSTKIIYHKQFAIAELAIHFT